MLNWVLASAKARDRELGSPPACFGGDGTSCGFLPLLGDVNLGSSLALHSELGQARIIAVASASGAVVFPDIGFDRHSVAGFACTSSTRMCIRVESKFRQWLLRELHVTDSALGLSEFMSSLSALRSLTPLQTGVAAIHRLLKLIELQCMRLVSHVSLEDTIVELVSLTQLPLYNLQASMFRMAVYSHCSMG